MNAIKYLNKNEDSELKEWVNEQLSNMNNIYDEIFTYIREKLDYFIEIQNEYNFQISTINRIRDSCLDPDSISLIFQEIDSEILYVNEEIAKEGQINRDMGVAWTTKELHAFAQ